MMDMPASPGAPCVGEKEAGGEREGTGEGKNRKGKNRKEKLAGGEGREGGGDPKTQRP